MNPRIPTIDFEICRRYSVALPLISQATQALGADCEPLFQFSDATTEAVLIESHARAAPSQFESA